MLYPKPKRGESSTAPSISEALRPAPNLKAQKLQSPDPLTSKPQNSLDSDPWTPGAPEPQTPKPLKPLKP